MSLELPAYPATSIPGFLLAGLGCASVCACFSTHRLWNSAIEHFRSIGFIGMHPALRLPFWDRNKRVSEHFRCFKRANQGDRVE
jgi:hypothetical protein